MKIDNSIYLFGLVNEIISMIAHTTTFGSNIYRNGE